MKTLLPILVLLISCAEEGPRYPVADVYKLEGQNDAWLILRYQFEHHYGIDIANPLIDDNLQVYWVDTKCPYIPDQNAVVLPSGQCAAGQTFSCEEIYVALDEVDPTRICNTALIHEYGHCALMLAGWDPDADHSNTELWNLTKEVRNTVCKEFP